jgi:hypothetical protein
MVLQHTKELRIRPYFTRRSRVKYGQYATIWCVVTLLSNEGNEGYPEMHFMLRTTSPKLDNIKYKIEKLQFLKDLNCSISIQTVEVLKTCELNSGPRRPSPSVHNYVHNYGRSLYLLIAN